MPLHGKIVVIKRSGGDGTEFPLTATCLFGRMPDCDIRIQLPQVSKEHCRIDLNENKEVILTNLSSVNPTRVNGQALQQSERLKHGDVITIIDRSFRFEYPPKPTPKKRTSEGRKISETLKVLQDQQVGDSDTAVKRISEASADPPLRDGNNQNNIQRSLDRTVELESESKAEGGLLENKTASPFNDLYQMIKQSLDVKTPRKSCPSVLQTPASRFCTPRPSSARKNDWKPIISTDNSTPKKDEAKVSCLVGEVKEEDENKSKATPKSLKKQRRSSQGPANGTAVASAENTAESEASSPQKRVRTPPQRFTAGDVESPKRRSKSVTPVKMEDEVVPSLEKASPGASREAIKAEQSKKRKSTELAADLPKSQMKKKRVSFGTQLSPELFDKRLPPDSPLRKGAAPRRSLSLLKPKESLLRRASVIGLLKFVKEQQTPSPKKPSSKTASPKTPASPKSKSLVPKAATPAKASPKSKSPSPKAKTPTKASLSSKPATPAKASPKSKSPSSKPATPAKKSPKSKSGKDFETPKSTKQTPTVQGRFSVSRISTPSPVPEETLTTEVPSVAVTPKIPLCRKSISRKTPRVNKSAVKVMLRRSGISRASMKVKSSWADIVKHGQPKTQVVAQTKKTIIRKMKKKAVQKPQTPAKALLSHVSTGHACSPVTIVVSRAQQQRLVQPSGAAPRLVTNVAVLKKNMKMDEDLTGVSEMFKTPVNERKKKSVISESSAINTPVGLATPVVDPSVLNTPEETGEMMVSPLSVTSSIKQASYSSEAVQRLLDQDEDSSFVFDAVAPEPGMNDARDEQGTDAKKTLASTPEQKPQLSDCLTGVKRIMKTPKQKAEPVEDLRGKLLKTPKQKVEQQECLTGVKRIMKTPRQKAEPVEDIRGKLLMTPKQKPEQIECLTGVKRIMETPQQVAENLEDLKVQLLETPKVPETETNAASLEIETIVVTPGEGREEVVEEPMTDATEQQETTEVEPQTPLDADVEVTKEIDVQEQAVEEEEEEEVTAEAVDEAPAADMETEADVQDAGIEEHRDEVSTGETVSQAAAEEAAPEEQPKEDKEDEALSEAQQAPETPTESLTETNPTVEADTVAEEIAETVCGPKEEEAACVPEEEETACVPEEEEAACVPEEEEAACVPEEEEAACVPEEEEAACGPEEEEAACDAIEIETAPAVVNKPVRGRRAKMVEAKAADDIQEAAVQPEDEPVVSAPVRGRRGKKSEAAAPAPVRQTARGRNAKSIESKEFTVKPKRGRNAGQASDDGAEEVSTEVEAVPQPESELIQAVEVNEEESHGAEPVEQVEVKPRRGRKPKQPQQAAPVMKDDAEDVPQTHVEEDVATEISTELHEAGPTVNEDESLDAKEMVPQEPGNEDSAEVEAETVVQKKPGRGRKAKTVETKPAEEKQEVAEEPEEPVVKAPIRGRRGRTAASKPAEEKPEVTEPLKEPVVLAPVRGRRGKAVEPKAAEQKQEVTEEPVVPAPVRGRRAKAVEPKPAEVNQEFTEEPEELVVPVPVRGRRGKKIEAAAPAEQLESEMTKAEDEEPPVEEAQPKQSVSAVAKPRRGRKAKPDTAEQNEEVDNTSVTIETKQLPPVRAKRGRNAKQEEQQPEEDDAEPETSKPQESTKKGRTTRKAEKKQEEPKEDILPVESVEAAVAEETAEASVATKPKRGGRKAKQDAETTAVKEVAAASTEDKPKRGTRARQATVESEENQQQEPEKEPKAEDLENVATVSKPSQGRGQKTAGKETVSQAAPAKRARRGAAPTVEEVAEISSQESESVEPAAVPAKRGRRAAAKTTANEVKIENEQETRDASSAAEDAKVSKRSVKWKPDLEVIDIPKATPVKAVRGRKSKLSDAGSEESKSEEKALSDATVEAPATKRARRGVKVADVPAEEAESQAKSAEAEIQPRSRRGRPAKK